jgi:outer membrane protein OmpA-like peptidoglycan-associated protein
VWEEDYNLTLSSRRADTLRDFLVSTGVTSSALVVSFHGESMPLVHTEDEVAEPRNRVEVIVNSAMFTAEAQGRRAVFVFSSE